MDSIAEFPVASTVTSDLPCRGCGYNLRGLSTGAACPECGLSIASALQGDLLRFAQPQWLHTIRRGIYFMLGSFAVLVGAWLIVGILRTFGVRVASVFPSTLSLLTAMIGEWLITTPDPSGLGEADYGVSRKIVRVTMWFSLIRTILTGIAGQMVTMPVVYLSLQITIFAARLVGDIGTFAEMSYLSGLTARVPDADMASRAKFLMYALGGTATFTTIAFAATKLIRSASGHQSFLYGLILLLGAGPLMAECVFDIMYLVLLVRFGQRLRVTIVFAEENWNRAEQQSSSANILEPPLTQLTRELPASP